MFQEKTTNLEIKIDRLFQLTDRLFECFFTMKNGCFFPKRFMTSGET